MNGKIDNRLSSHEIPIRSLISLTLIAIFVSVLVIPQALDKKRQDRYRFPIERSMIFLQFPHVVAAGLTIESGLEEFGGRPAKAVEPRMGSLIAVGFLIGYVIGPALLFAALRRRFCGDRPPLPLAGSILGMISAGFWMALVIPLVVIQFNLRSNVRTGQSIQASKDEIINTITEIRVNAMEYRVLPRALSGGGGSYSGYRLPQRLRETSTARFDVVVENEVIRILAVPTVNPRSRFTSEPELPVPPASVATKLDAQGMYSKWTYSGLYQ